MEEKVVVALTSVAVGWFLSQATEFVKSRKESNKIKRALMAELSDAMRCSGVAIETCEEFKDQLRSATYGVIVPQPIRTHVFDKYYPEIYSEFNPQERFALQAIYNHIDNFNSTLPKISESNVITCFGDLFSSVLWLQASINQYQKDPKVLISEIVEEVDRVNTELNTYMGAIGLIKK
ncbi:hypothetical protein ACFL5R_01175 [Pseudomonadota bacterium]